jgi:hypothetical protein
MAKERGRRALLPAILFAVVATLVIAATIATARRMAEQRQPTAAELRAAPEVRALGHAHPIRGRPDRYGRARYAYRIELLDGRTASYVADRLIGARTCVEVLAREYQGRLIVLKLVELEASCEGDDLGKLTR